MGKDEPKDPKVSAEVKIRPRGLDAAKTQDEDEEPEESAPPQKPGPLPKRSGPDWLAKLTTVEPGRSGRKRRRRRERHSAEVQGANGTEAAGKDLREEDSEVAEEMDSGFQEPDDSRDDHKVKIRKRRDTFAGLRKKWLRWVGPALLEVGPYAIPIILLAALAHSIGRSAGEREGRNAAAQEAAAAEEERIRVLSPQGEARLEAALGQLREGDSAAAARTLQALAGEFPDVPSMDFLAARACVQAGDSPTAKRFAMLSIKKGQRVSDSLALLSVIESQKAGLPEHQRMGDPLARARQMIEEAMAADPANPGPRMELGALLRTSGDQEGAMQQMRAAELRMLPVDSQLAADITIALIQAEALPMSESVPVDENSPDVRRLFSDAYLALRRDDVPLAIRLLKRCQAMIPPDLFHYLVNDPAFRRFAYQPELKRLMGE